MKLLVCGGAGFIGSNFIELISKKYPLYKIINYDKLTYSANKKQIKKFLKNPNYKFIQGDICNFKKVKNIIKGVDAIINFAAETSVDRSLVDDEQFLKTNVLGVHVLAKLSIAYGVNRFIQISTDEVYGSIAKGEAAEDWPLAPSNPYAVTKAAADCLLASYSKTYGLPLIILRGCNNFGPYQFPEKIIPLFILRLIKKQKVPLYGNGRNIREWIFVRDFCRAIDVALHHGKIGEIYNVSTGFRISNLELTKLILKIFGKKNNFISKTADRLNHDFRYALNCEKIKKLGWQSEASFNKALNETIRWYKQNSTL